MNRQLLIPMFAALAVMLSCGGARGAQSGAPVRLLFVRGEFSDAAMEVPPDQWRERLKAVCLQAEKYWVQVSYRKITRFEAQCTEVFTLPEPSSAYQGGGKTHQLNQAMRKLATEAGWNLKDFDHLVLSYPGVLNQPFGAAGLPGTVWLPGKNPYGPGLIHEFGHAFGVGHASSFEGGVPFPGEHREGRDGLFMMGSDDGRLTTVNLPMKYMMGFIDDRYLVEVTKPQTVRIAAFDVETLPRKSQTLAAKFTLEGKEFWVSYAPRTGETWSDLGGRSYTRGVVVQQVEKKITRLIDFTPGSSGGTGNKADYVDTRDGALQVGQKYTFPNTSFTIAPLRTGGDPKKGQWIEVRFSKERTDSGGKARNRQRPSSSAKKVNES